MKADTFNLVEYLSKNILLEDTNALDIINMISNNNFDALDNLPADKSLLNKVISLLQDPKYKEEKNKVNQMSCEINEFKGKNTFLTMLLAAASILGGCSSKEVSPQEKPGTEVGVDNSKDYYISETNTSVDILLNKYKEKNPKLIWGNVENVPGYNDYSDDPKMQDLNREVIGVNFTSLYSLDDGKYILVSESGSKGLRAALYDNKSKLLNGLKTGIKAFEKAKETNTFKKYKEVDDVTMQPSIIGNKGKFSDGFFIPGAGDQAIAYEDALELVKILN